MQLDRAFALNPKTMAMIRNPEKLCAMVVSGFRAQGFSRPRTLLSGFLGP